MAAAGLPVDAGQHAWIGGRIDDLLRRHAEHWKLERMAAVDRNVLRLALYELMHCP